MSDQPFRFLDEEPPAVTPSPAPAAPPGALLPEAEPGWAPTLLEPEPEAPTELPDNWAPGRIDIPAGPARSVGLAVAGLAVLIVTWALCSIVSFIISLAAHSLWLAAPALVAMLAGLGLIVAAGRIELRSYRRLAEVEKLRRSLADDAQPIAAVRADAIVWIGHVPSLEAERVALTQALGAVTTHAELRALLRSRVVAKLAARAAELGKRAALEGAAMIAISPHQSWDGLIAGLRGLAVIRQVARLHGIRPGPAVTFTLLRHVVATAAGTAGIELLSQTVTDKVLGSVPFVKHIYGALPGSGLAAMRLYRLARLAASACCPIDG